MTVAELIEKLKAYPDDMPVVVPKDELGEAWLAQPGLSIALAGRAGSVDYRLALRADAPYLDVLVIE